MERAAYLVMAGFGLDAKMLSQTDEDLKAKVGWLAYVDAIRKALRDKNRMRMRYRLDRRSTRAVSAHTLIVGNCGSLPANILLLPTAAIDDGRFEAVFLRPESAWGWVQILVKVIWENGVLRRTKLGHRLVGRDVDALRYVKGRRLDVVLSRPEEVELDGDSFGRADAFRTWIDAGGLTVRVPASEEEPTEQEHRDAPAEHLRGRDRRGVELRHVRCHRIARNGVICSETRDQRIAEGRLGRTMSAESKQTPGRRSRRPRSDGVGSCALRTTGGSTSFAWQPKAVTLSDSGRCWTPVSPWSSTTVIAIILRSGSCAACATRSPCSCTGWPPSPVS